MTTPVEAVSRHYVEGQYFDKILIAGVFDVKLTHTSEPVKVEVEALPEGHDFVKIETHNDHTLSIRLLDSYSQPFKILVHIKFNLLKNYTSNQLVGSTNSTNVINQNEKFVLCCNQGTENVNLQLRVPEFDAFLSGTGHHVLSGNVTNETNIICNGVVDVDASNLSTTKMNIEANGFGKVTIQANDEINVHADGMCTVYYKGPLKTVLQNGMAQVVPY